MWFATISDETTRNFHIFSSKTPYTWTVRPVSICKSFLQILHVSGNSFKNSKPKEHNKDQSTCTTTSHARIFAQTWRFWDTDSEKKQTRMDEFGWRIRGTLVIWRNFLTWMIWINVSVMITETVGFINLARVADEYLRFHVVSYVFHMLWCISSQGVFTKPSWQR